MAIKLCRRHRKECEAELRDDSRSGELEEGRRGWKRCVCLIHASGTLGKKSSRKNTGQSDWEKARAVLRAWESAGSGQIYSGEDAHERVVAGVRHAQKHGTRSGKSRIDRPRVAHNGPEVWKLKHARKSIPEIAETLRYRTGRFSET